MRNAVYLVLLIVSFLFMSPLPSHAQLTDGTWSAAKDKSPYIPSDFPVIVLCMNCLDVTDQIADEDEAADDISDKVLTIINGASAQIDGSHEVLSEVYGDFEGDIIFRVVEMEDSSLALIIVHDSGHEMDIELD